ncbi:unnamed protein product, partial [Rotaria magnacalcarata]
QSKKNDLFNILEPFHVLRVALLVRLSLIDHLLYHLKQSSSNMRLDSNTAHIVKKCLTLLKLSADEDLFCNIVQQLVQSVHIICSSTTYDMQSMIMKKQETRKISSSFINTYLVRVFSANNLRLCQIFKYILNFIEKYHWHVYKEIDSTDLINILQSILVCFSLNTCITNQNWFRTAYGAANLLDYG